MRKSETKVNVGGEEKTMATGLREAPPKEKASAQRKDAKPAVDTVPPGRPKKEPPSRDALQRGISSIET